MGYDVTRQGLGWTLFFFALLLLLFREHSLAGPVTFDPLSAGDMPLGTALAGVARRLPVLSGVLSAVLALAGGIVLTRIVSRNMILLERTYMPILLYPAVGCSVYFGPESLPALAASLLTIASFDTMLVSFRRTARFGSLFNSTILAGSALLVWSHTAVYVLLLPFALAVFKRSGREWIVAWAGMLLPLAICSYVEWGAGRPFLGPVSRLWDGVRGTLVGPGLDLSTVRLALWVFWGMCLTVTVLSLVTLWRRSGTMRTRAYKSSVYFLWILFFSLLPLAAPGRAMTDFVLPAAPLAVVLPAYFNRRSGWIPDAVYLLLFGSVVCYGLLSWAGY